MVLIHTPSIIKDLANELKKSIQNAVIYYYTTKDKEIENKIKKYLLSNPKDIEEIKKEIKNIILKKYPIIEEIKIKDISIGEKKTHLIKVFDLEKKEFITSFKKEVFKGVIETNLDFIEQIKPACISYARAVASYEHKFLKNTFLEEKIASIQNKIANEWKVPIIIGEWSDSKSNETFFFWKIKEVREKLLKSGIKIAPTTIYYSFNENELLGWGEIR